MLRKATMQNVFSYVPNQLQLVYRIWTTAKIERRATMKKLFEKKSTFQGWQKIFSCLNMKSQNGQQEYREEGDLDESHLSCLT